MPPANLEFAKVQLGPPLAETSGSEVSENGSDFESDLTDKEDDPDEEYAVDAIKYAYWLKKKNGVKAQWYYGILWGGYLKTESEMDIPSEGIAEDDDLKQDQVYQFWSSFNVHEVPTARLPPGKREPKEPLSKSLKYPHIFECPGWRMKEWLKEASPKRSFSTYLARRQYIKNNSDRPHLTPVPKKYSDYYVLKKEERRRKKDEATAAKPGAASRANPTESEREKSNGGTQSKESTPVPSAPPNNEDEQEVIDMITETVQPPSPGLFGLSDLDSAAGGEPSKALTKPAPISSTRTKRKLQTSLSKPKTKSKKNKNGSLAKSSATPAKPIPPATNRLNGLGKIKKKGSDPLFYPPLSPPSTADTSTHLFGEPVSGIFEPELPAHGSNSLATDERPPTPFSATPAREPVASQQPDPIASKRSATVGSSEKIPQPTESVPSLLEQTRAILARQAAEAKPKSDAALIETEACQTKTVASTSSAKPKGESKPDLSSHPRYQQPVRMKFIDEAINPEANPYLPPGPGGTLGKPGPSFKPPRGSSASHPPLSAIGSKPATDPDQSSLGSTARSLGSANATPPLASATTIPSHRGSHQVQPPRHFSALAEQSVQASSTQAIPTGSRMDRFAPLPDQSTSYGAARFPPPASRGPKVHAASSGTVSSQIVQSNGHTMNKSGPVPRAPQAYHPRQPGPPTDIRQSNLAHLPSQTPLAPVFNPAADPRRRAVAPGQSPGPQQNPPHPYGHMSPTDFHALRANRSPVRDNRKLSQEGAPPVDKICDFRADIQLTPNVDTHFKFGLLKGSTAPWAERLNLTRFFLSSPRPSPIQIAMEEVDDICLTGILNLGGQVAEWCRPTLVQEHSGTHTASKGESESLKERICKGRRAFVAYTEYTPERGVSNHYAIVLASPDATDLRHIGLGHWTADTIKLGLFIVALPLTSVPVPSLPNPVRPALDIPSNPGPPQFPPTVSVLESYGFHDAFLGSLSGTKVMKYPGEDGPTDFLHGILSAKLKAVNAIPASEVDTSLVLNQKFGKTLKSSSIRTNLLRRTAFYAYGPSIQLYPSQWGLTPIWLKGGLVTFSPTTILRNPDAFSDIMKMIRTVDTWAAYVLPGVVQWCRDSWDMPLRCPEPTRSFEELTRSLCFDESILPLSGALSSSGGGLAVSCAPPVIHNADGCRKWMEWLRRVTEEKSFNKLVDHCIGVTSRDFSARTASGVTGKATDLELIDLERAQIEDMIAMRARPHLLPYRRYIYIGGTSLAEDVRAQIREIEFVSPGDFSAVLSGAM